MTGTCLMEILVPSQAAQAVLALAGLFTAHQLAHVPEDEVDALVERHLKEHGVDDAAKAAAAAELRDAIQTIRRQSGAGMDFSQPSPLEVQQAFEDVAPPGLGVVPAMLEITQAQLQLEKTEHAAKLVTTRVLDSDEQKSRGKGLSLREREAKRRELVVSNFMHVLQLLGIGAKVRKNLIHLPPEQRDNFMMFTFSKWATGTLWNHW